MFDGAPPQHRRPPESDEFPFCRSRRRCGSVSSLAATASCGGAITPTKRVIWPKADCSTAAAPPRPVPKLSRLSAHRKFGDCAASPDLVGTKADRDIPLPANVRRYYFPGVTHGGGRGRIFRAYACRPAGAANCRTNPEPVFRYDARAERGSGRLGGEGTPRLRPASIRDWIAANWSRQRTGAGLSRRSRACLCRTES